MTYFANYSLSVKTAVEVLEDFSISQVPINLNIIFRGMDRELAIKTYKEFMDESKLSLTEIITFFDSELGTCCYDPKSGRYVIYYNDLKSKAFIRFTLAHELGHIFLGHHIKAETNILSRSFISNTQYMEFEKEANVFARNLLSPAPLAWEVIEKGQSRNQKHDIEYAFNITGLAANVRINMIRRDLKDYTLEMRNFIKKIKIKYHKHCTKCHSWLPKKVNYCMFCGNDKTNKSLWYKDFPKEIKTNKNGFFIQCPTCGNMDIAINSRFCMICSSPLKNLCNGQSKNNRTHKCHNNRSFSLFCEECGSPTYYNEHNIEIRQEENEMIYNDGVPYNSDTLRVKICPICKNESFSNTAQYCIICGNSLYNTCEGTLTNNYNGESYYDNIHCNPSNARFCETCGKPTLFFKKGLLIDYKTFQSNIENNLPSYPLNDEKDTSISNDNFIPDFSSNTNSPYILQDQDDFDLPF